MEVEETQASEKMDNEISDTENTCQKKKKRSKSEKQKERTREYKRKIRKEKRRKQAVQRILDEMFSTICQDQHETNLDTVSDGSEKGVSDPENGSEEEMASPVSDKMSELNASAEEFVPSTVMQPEEEIPHSSVNAMAVNTCEKNVPTRQRKKRKRSEKQIQRAREYRMNKERMRTEGERGEKVRRTAPQLYVPATSMTGADGLFIYTHLLAPGYVYMPSPEDIYGFEYSQMLVPYTAFLPYATSYIYDVENDDNIYSEENYDYLYDLENDDFVESGGPNIEYSYVKPRESATLFNSQNITNRVDKQVKELCHVSQISESDSNTAWSDNVQINPEKLSPKEKLLATTEAISPELNVPGANIRIVSDRPTKLTGLLFLPSARNIPESLRASANIFIYDESIFPDSCAPNPLKQESVHTGTEGDTTTGQRNDYSKLKASANEYLRRSQLRQRAVNPTSEASKNAFVTPQVKSLEKGGTHKASVDGLLPGQEEDVKLKISAYDSLPSAIKSTTSKSEEKGSWYT